MTEVREPDSRIELKPAEESRQTLVSRALAPIRWAKGREVAPLGTENVGMRLRDPLELAPKRKFNILRWSFVAIVVLPILISGVYLYAFASDIYVSETRFAVLHVDSSSKEGSKSEASSSPLMGGANLGGQDSEIVASYIHSPSIIADLASSVDVRAIFSRSEADFWARLPKDASAEDLSTYWNKMISVYIESSSGIITVSASAFRRDDSQVLAQAILESCRKLVNSMSQKIRDDLSGQAEDEVRRSEGEVRFALADLTAFRNSQHLIDPIKQATSTSMLISGLMTERIELETTLFIAQRAQGPDAPGLSLKRDRLESINKQIKQLQDQIAGNAGSENMATTLAAFEELEIKRQFAERMYGFARDGVERARLAAQQKSIYLAAFVRPSLPQDFTYPVRGTDLGLIALVGLMTWLSGLTITASILDHRL